MKLNELLSSIDLLQIVGDPAIEICDVQIDSRKVQAGHLFIALRGTQVDGHTFISTAVRQGAAAILCEELPQEIHESVTYAVVSSTEKSVGPAAHRFFGSPTEKLTLVGVTGTNGKTTIATLLYNMYRGFGYKTGLLSTVCNYIDDRAVEAVQTTPDPISLNRMLAAMVEAGCTYAFMEVSSHAVVQHRIDGLCFAGGIFTNLTRDHLDYHKTFDAYRDAKKAFFDELPCSAFALSNKDDRNGEVMLQNTRAQKKYYSLRTLCDYKGKILESHFEGMLLDIDGREVAVPFIGRFNASNLLAVYGAACSLGQDPEKVLLMLSTLHPVSGRFEAVRSPKGYTAIVDYAHTPDALINVLDSIHAVLTGRGRVITVVGAGGNRDKGKRPIMAAEAAHRSDRLIITSDNPRFEEPQAIIDDMLAGLSPEDRQKTVSITDRREAIRTACLLAEQGDVILVAGKGHENYQDIKGVKHHFDDKEVLREAMNS